jgi:CubicO group peptidase (beta-lactamase class C family)
MRRPPRVIVFGVAALTGASSASAQAPAALTFDPARAATIDSLLERAVRENRLPGGVLRVHQHGRVVYERAAGWADIAAQRRMTTDALFRIASQTKALTSVAIMQLVESGRVGLNEPVSRWIPSFARTQVMTRQDGGYVLRPLTRAITIRDLLTHTAGISYGTDSVVAATYRAAGLGPAAGWGWYTADKDEPVCTTMDRLGTMPIMAQPGAGWVYGYNTDILGCVVERASGETLDAYVRARITGPLGMTNTFFFVPAGQESRLTTVYRSDSAGRAERAPDDARGQGHYVRGPRRSFSGGAGLVSTAADYARFLEMIRNDGAIDGVRVLSPRSVHLMRTNQIGSYLARDAERGFGYGFETVERLGASSYKSLGAYGWAGAYGSTYSIDPSNGLVIVWMMQLMPNGTDIQERLIPAVYQALVPARP